MMHNPNREIVARFFAEIQQTFSHDHTEGGCDWGR